MIFNTLWTIILGVIGGVASSLIVSRVLFIQSEYQNQIKFVDRIIRKTGNISSFLQCAESILQVSYDQRIQMEKEMKEKGYHTEAEYYTAHSDQDWISKKDVLKVFRKEISKIANLIHEDLAKNPVEDAQLNMIINSVVAYIHDALSMKEYTFARIAQLKKTEQVILKQYDDYVQMSGNKLFRLVIKDKIMIIMFIIIVILGLGAIITYTMGI